MTRACSFSRTTANLLEPRVEITWRAPLGGFDGRLQSHRAVYALQDTEVVHELRDEPICVPTHVRLEGGGPVTRRRASSFLLLL